MTDHTEAPEKGRLEGAWVSNSCEFDNHRTCDGTYGYDDAFRCSCFCHNRASHRRYP